MPIEIKVLVGEREIEQPPILSGQAASFTDYSPAGDSIIVISCDASDEGGLVARHSTTETIRAKDSMLRILGALGDIVDEVPNNGTFRMNANLEGGPGELCLRHYNL